MMLDRIDLARIAARRRDAQLADLIAGAAGHVCPFPIVVEAIPDYGLLRVRAGRRTLLDFDRDAVATIVAAADDADLAAIRLGQHAAAAYAALNVDVPANVTLGAE